MEFNILHLPLNFSSMCTMQKKLYQEALILLAKIAF